MESELLVEDNISENSRSVVLDIGKDELLQALYASDGFVSRVQYTMNETVMLCSEDFLQSVDIYPISEQGLGSESKSFDDYFSSGQDTEEPEKQYTKAIVAPYKSMPSMSEDTGRNYLAEKDKALQFILSIAEQTVEQTKLSTVEELQDGA